MNHLRATLTGLGLTVVLSACWGGSHPNQMTPGTPSPSVPVASPVSAPIHPPLPLPALPTFTVQLSATTVAADEVVTTRVSGTNATQVEGFLDGIAFGSSSSLPAQLMIPTRTLGAGIHQVAVQARNSSGAITADTLLVVTAPAPTPISTATRDGQTPSGPWCANQAQDVRVQSLADATRAARA